MLAGDPLVSLWIDLNMVSGDRVVTARDFVVVGGSLPVLVPGQIVRVVEEEGDVYLAVVERLGERNLVYLRLLLNTWQPAVDMPSPELVADPSAEWETDNLIAA